MLLWERDLFVGNKEEIECKESWLDFLVFFVGFFCFVFFFEKCSVTDLEIPGERMNNISGFCRKTTVM